MTSGSRLQGACAILGLWLAAGAAHAQGSEPARAVRCQPEETRYETAGRGQVQPDGTVEFVDELGARLPPPGSKTVLPAPREHGQLAKLCDGTYVSVREYEFKFSTRIVGRHLDAQGQALAEEFVILPYEENGWSPSVAASADGGFVVAWQTLRRRGSAVHAQRFGRTLEPLGARIAISAAPTGSQVNAFVVGMPSGGFAVTWHLVSPSQPWQAYLRTFSRSGRPVSPLQVVTTGRYVSPPFIRILCDGSLLVFWGDGPGRGWYKADFVRQYGAEGLPLSDAMSKDDERFAKLAASLIAPCTAR
jgi:hypothetical protein